jgi:hypothetical protein
MTDFANDVIEWGSPPTNMTLLALTKQILGIVDTARDVELSMYLDMAGNACERYIDNIIEQREVTERIAKKYIPVPLRYYPVTTVTSVLIDGVESIGDFTQGQDDGIEWVLEGISNYTKSTDFKQMDIVYTAGFDPIPSDIGFAIVRAAILYSQNTAAGGPIKKQVIEGVGSIEYDTSSNEAESVGMMPPSTVAALDPYRRIYA